MRKLWWLTFFVALNLGAQPLEKSLLWKISGNGLAQPSYLFGTIHIACEADITPKMQQALSDTKQLVLELDMDDPGMQTAMMSGMMMPGGSWITLVPEADRKTVDDYLKANLGMGTDQLGMIKPALLAMMFYPQMLDCPMKSMEQELMKRAQADGENVGGLETVQDQLAALDAMPLEEQVKELVKSAKDDMQADKDELRQMLAIYKTQDIELMHKVTLESPKAEAGNYETELLDKRNRNWIPKIGEIAKSQPTFFAVGAAHLAGENGVIRLLRKAGFTVEAVK